MRVKDIVRSLPPGDDWIANLSSHKKDIWVHADRVWADGILGRFVCPECRTLLPDLFPTPVDPVLIELPKQSVYDGVWHGGASVIRNDLLAVLRPDLPEHVLGSCHWKDGREVTGYQSICFRHLIQGRGVGVVNYYRCRRCGFAGCTSQEPYVLRSELPDGNIFVDGIQSMYFSASFTRKFPWRSFPELRPWVIPVRDAPLPEDPLGRIEDAVRELAAKCGGDVESAYAAVEAEVSKLPLSDGSHTVRVQVAGIPLTANVYVPRRGGAMCVSIRDDPPPEDPLDRGEGAIRKLSAKFGDTPAAYAAVDAEVAKLTLPEGQHTVRMQVGGIPLAVRVYVWPQGRPTKVTAFTKESPYDFYPDDKEARRILAAPLGGPITEKKQPNGDTWRYDAGKNYLVIVSPDGRITGISRPLEGCVGSFVLP